MEAAVPSRASSHQGQMLTPSCDPSLRHSANTSCTQWWPLALTLGREWGCEQGGQLPASQRPRPSQPLTRWTGTGLSPSAPLLDGGSRRAGPALRPGSCSPAQVLVGAGVW